MSDDSVLFEVRDSIAHVTLNRPQAGNALDLEMAKQLMAVALRCEADQGVRAVLLKGAGKSFCAGGDVKVFLAQKELPAYLREITSYLHLAISRFARLDAPVIAAVQGSAAGGGFSLAISGDLVIAAESATFLMAYSKIGMAPDGGSTYFLPRLVGLKRAMELALINRVLSAREACEWGLVTEVVPPENLESRAEELARSLAQGPTGAFGSAKRLLHEGWNQTLETQMELESRAIAETGATTDGQEGIRAFVEKRKAGSIKIETHLDVHFHGDWLAITGSGIEAPSLNFFHGAFIQAHAQRPLQPDPGNFSGFVYNDFENHSSLILGIASLH
jgi:2-(1,2-epoxy-1,2-dihydrophenyl)acetyl-CoA isomerase